MEKRIVERTQVLKAGIIEFPGGAFSCMVRNLSESGAALDLPSSIGIPDHFTLVMAIEGARYFCRSVWRKERRIGVTFYCAEAASLFQRGSERVRLSLG